MRILIVDDQSRTRQSLRLLLQTVPEITDIQEARNGREAVELSAHLHPDLVVMDGRMPEMDGLQAASQIKAGRRPVKIVMLSMYPEYGDSIGPQGADAFVSKGDPPELLVETICKLLELPTQ